MFVMAKHVMQAAYGFKSMIFEVLISALLNKQVSGDVMWYHRVVVPSSSGPCRLRNSTY